jgi:hypothetical protein
MIPDPDKEETGRVPAHICMFSEVIIVVRTCLSISAGVHSCP